LPVTSSWRASGTWIAPIFLRPAQLTRHISLRQIDPYALNQLREKGDAKFKVPEVLFDIDHPGYYDRRIKSIYRDVAKKWGDVIRATGIKLE